MLNQKNTLPALLFGVLPHLCTLCLLLLSIQIAAQEVEDEREFEYDIRSVKGPKHWGEMHEDWIACKNGTAQSPIDMSSQRVERVQNLGKLMRIYKAANASILNRGHDIAVKWEGSNAGYILIEGTKYFLHQSHWHSPSEHTLNGIRYDLELHMVHETLDPNAEHKVAVVGQLYQLGQPDPFLSKLTRKIRTMVDIEMEQALGIINPREIILKLRRYYRYLGSLTVPPCTEGVLWTISSKVRTVSKEQVALLRDAVHDSADENARPLQNLKIRRVYMYDPGLQVHN